MVLMVLILSVFVENSDTPKLYNLLYLWKTLTLQTFITYCIWEKLWHSKVVKFRQFANRGLCWWKNSTLLNMIPDWGIKFPHTVSGPDE